MFEGVQRLSLITPEIAQSFPDDELIRRFRWTVQCYVLAKGYEGEPFYRNNLATLRRERYRRQQLHTEN